MKLKVCGMRDPENIREISTLQPDFMGFIFFPKSPRNVSDEITNEQLPANGVKKVGVFVNEVPDIVKEKAATYQLDLLQLHGNESPAYCEAMKNDGYSIIKVFSVGNEFNFANLEAYLPFVDYFLFDTKGKYYGGNGEVFNWEILNNYHLEKPFFLSGGIDEQNVEQIDKIKNPWLFAIDVNSKFEISPALKDVERVKKLKEKLKSHE